VTGCGGGSFVSRCNAQPASTPQLPKLLVELQTVRLNERQTSSKPQENESFYVCYVTCGAGREHEPRTCITKGIVSRPCRSCFRNVWLCHSRCENVPPGHLLRLPATDRARHHIANSQFDRFDVSTDSTLALCDSRRCEPARCSQCQSARPWLCGAKSKRLAAIPSGVQKAADDDYDELIGTFRLAALCQPTTKSQSRLVADSSNAASSFPSARPTSYFGWRQERKAPFDGRF